MEISYLKEISKSIQNDSLALVNNISWNAKGLQQTKSLKKHLLDNRPYNDSLESVFSKISLIVQYKFNREIYESLKSSGINLISNDSLRFSIINYYNETLKIEDLHGRFDLLIYSRDIVYPKFFKSFVMNSEAVPNDYDELKSANDFLIYLDFLINDYNWLIDSYKNFGKIISGLQKEIGIELRR
ncbi:hypothetical protein [Aegicerativicinus sediminis]|uniref:hypothetical protein n=1 Tax=Aegicerativicinus sediminis TaxID=2893202 RepID=UPI001E6243FA|nr:hypothetical protein [Aegicerativicinus sediminis]